MNFVPNFLTRSRRSLTLTSVLDAFGVRPPQRKYILRKS